MSNRNKIMVSDISKRYRIGGKKSEHKTMIGQLSSLLTYPIRKYKDLKNLSSFEEVSDDENIVWALKNVSFTVEEGEVLGIVGNNGAGKSTLLKVISRITSPTNGKINLNGRVASLLEVGTGFHPELTGRENIFLNGSILGMNKKEIAAKMDQIINFSGWQVDKFIDTPVKKFSTGMRVRLAFSIAAHTDPDILLIDEVLAVGDQDFQNKCLKRMENISTESGKTIIFVSHDLQAIEKLCDRVIILSEGKLAFDGIPSEAIDYYFKIENAKWSSDAVGFIDGLKRDRNCDKSVMFRSINIINNFDSKNFSIQKGENLVLKIDIEFKKKVSTFFTFAILLNHNNSVYTSPMVPVLPKNIVLNSRKSFSFEIKNFNLNEGIYYMKLDLGNARVKHDSIWRGLPPLKVVAKEKLKKKTAGIVDFNFDFKEFNS